MGVPPTPQKSMETKELLDKFINGEFTQEQFDTEVLKLSPEAKAQLEKEAAEKMPSAVERLKGVRKGIDAISQKNAQDDSNFAIKLRDENLQAAKLEAFKKFKIKDEDRESFMEAFKKFDTGNVTVDNIFEDMKRTYASLNADTLLTLQEQQEQREQEAEDFNANNGGGGSGGGGDPTKKISKEVKALMEKSAKMGRPMTAERAERALELAKKGGRIG